MSQIWKLLRSKLQTDEWHAGHRAALKSAFANRQWSQTRCFGANFVKHGKCLLCLDDIVKRRLPHLTDQQRELTEPNAEDIAAAPVGNLFHRITSCPRVISNCKATRPDLETFFLLDPSVASSPLTSPLTPSHMCKELSIGSENPFQVGLTVPCIPMGLGLVALVLWLGAVGPSLWLMLSAKSSPSPGASPQIG